MISLSEYPILSLIVATLLTLLLMYLVRVQAHDLILRSARLLFSQLRLISRASHYTAQRIRLRNHEVIKALAESLMERQLERRFMRIEKLVERDLANYQQLSAGINKQLVSIEEDYAESAQVPDVSPEWVSAVEAIANLQGDERNTDVMGKILDDIHNTIQRHQRDALREHRWTVSARHKVLSKLQPQWRKLSKMLQHIDNNIEMLRLRLQQVDQHMTQFEMLTSGSGQGIMSSVLMRFVTSLCFVAVGVGAAWINWQLLHQPLLALLPPQQLEGVPLAGVVSGLHIAMTLMAATMISESLRITHFFPLASAMTRRGRQTIIVIAGSLLLALTVMESLALLGTPVVVSITEMTSVSQLLLVVLGSVLPLLLSLVVIPAEYMLHTVRPVMGSLLQLLLHVTSVILRQVASLSLHVGRLLVHVYDLFIFVPLRLEKDWKQRKAARQLAEQSDPQSTVEAENVTALKFGTERRQ